MVDRLERLINLVIALRETRRPIPAAEVRERVAGYDQPDAEAFRRMFERDKADLRALGVPLASEPIDRWDDRQGYRIHPEAYDLPPVSLEPGELAALALALQATGLAEEAGAGLRKLEVDAALEDAGDAPPPGSRAGRAVIGVALEAPHRRELMEAQLSRTAVRFPYAAVGREVEERVVDPHALVHRAGRWYVVGRDHRRDARRAFRLDRIAGPVQTSGSPGGFVAPDARIGVEDVVPAVPAGGPQLAELAVDASVAWQVARSALGGGRRLGDRTAFTVPVGDPEAFLTWALEYGPDLEVLGPPSLRRAIVARARVALEVAGGAGR